MHHVHAYGMSTAAPYGRGLVYLSLWRSVWQGAYAVCACLALLYECLCLSMCSFVHVTQLCSLWDKHAALLW